MTTTKIGTVTLSRPREYRLNHRSDWGVLPSGTYDVVRDGNGFIYWEGPGKLAWDHVVPQEIGDRLFPMRHADRRTREQVTVRSVLFDAAGFAGFLRDHAADAGITYTPITPGTHH